MKNNFKKKPTNKELANTIVEISNRMNYLYNIVRGFDGIFSIYLDMKGDKEKLEKELENTQGEINHIVKVYQLIDNINITKELTWKKY